MCETREGEKKKPHNLQWRGPRCFALLCFASLCCRCEATSRREGRGWSSAGARLCMRAVEGGKLFFLQSSGVLSGLAF